MKMVNNEEKTLKLLKAGRNVFIQTKITFAKNVTLKDTKK